MFCIVHMVYGNVSINIEGTAILNKITVHFISKILFYVIAS